MPLIQDSQLMDSSSFFVQGPFNGSSDNLSIGTSTNVSPNHQTRLNLNHSNSDTSIQQPSGGGLGSGGSGLHHSFSNNNNSNNSTTGGSSGGGVTNGNENASPLHLSSMLHGLSMNSGLNTSSMSQQHQDLHSSSFNQGAGSYLLKMKNLPQDITSRETYAIFALADGVINVELIKEPKFSNSSDDYEFSILAKFGSLPLATHYASILSSKSDIFGPSYPFTTYIEVIDELANQQVLFQRPDFQLSQPNYHLSSSTLPPTPVTSQQQSQKSQPPSSRQQPQQESPISSSGAGSRPGILQTRLRFSFSDPFFPDPLGGGGVGTATSADMHSQQQQQQQQQQQSQSQQQTQTGSRINHSRSHQESTSSQPSDVGKSFLLMDNDDINDTIWGGNGIPSSMNGFSTTPQPSTPILDWGSSGRNTSSSFFLPQTSNSASATQSTPTVDIPTTSAQGLPISTPTRSSIPPFNLLGKISSAGSNLPNVMGGSSDLGIASRKNQTFISGAKQPQQGPQTAPPATSQTQLQNPSLSTTGVSATPSTATMSVDSTQKVSQNRSSGARNAHSGAGAQKNNLSSSSSSNNVAGSNTISQADLSLLARVPPPANPADQNPPCNTLYVGNLPPDATEQELRQLFSGQQGFRRLSFRNKNSNGNGHGPMCFVEFEDVSFATRALAELYGSQLPRVNASNKGGIRLSFSKNPLGVRCSNNRRGGSNTAINGQSGGGNSAQSFARFCYSNGYNKT